MKYLVTGGEGFIGSKIVERLNCNSYDKKSGQDILNQEKLVKSLKDINTVFHTAAKISVPESQKKPEEYYDVNVKGTKNIVNLSESKIIFSSSAAVYGEYDRKVVEEDKLNTNIIINFYYNQITFSLFNIKLASLQRIYS